MEVEKSKIIKKNSILIGQKKSGKIRKIKVDREKCIGARSCVFFAQNVFQLDDENLAYIVDLEGDNEDQILLAAKSCPVLAIEIFDENGEKIV